VVSVIESCVPNIKNAWQMPSMDIDTLLVSIRIATYGHELDISTKCPACENEADFGLDLRLVMEQIKSPDYGQVMKLGDLEIYFRPMTYQQMNENSMTQFQDQKLLQILNNTDSDDATRVKQLSDALKKITQFTTNALAQNIAMIRTPQSQVVQIEHIAEWLGQCDRGTFARIRDFIINTKQQGELQPLGMKCSQCEHEYKQAFTLDMTNFFEVAS
jgi:hypothetical protein